LPAPQNEIQGKENTMKILFVGTVEHGFVFEEYADVTYTGRNDTVAGQLSDVLKDEKFDFIAVDVAHAAEHYKEQVSAIDKIQKAANSTIIVMAVGFDKESVLIQSLHGIGISYFVFSPILTHQKEEIIHALNGIPTEFSDSDDPEPPVLDIQSETADRGNVTTVISVVGACHRIGTTTQAIQLVKFLLLQGKRAAYIELNSTHYVERLQRLYDVPCSDEDKEAGRVSYENVDMYHKAEKITDVLHGVYGTYDYLVYDFGCFTDKDFNLINFLERDVRVVVGGTKPNEIESISAIIGKTLMNDVSYIFSFCPPDEQSDVLELMESKAEKTVFAPLTPDPFLYAVNSDVIYNRLVRVNDDVRQQEKKPKRRFSFLSR
jgi:hypothetical protein